MHFVFFAPFYPILGEFTPFIFSYIVNTLFILTYSWLFESELDDRKLLIVSFLLVPIDFAVFIVSSLVSGMIIRAPYWLWATGG